MKRTGTAVHRLRLYDDVCYPNINKRFILLLTLQKQTGSYLGVHRISTPTGTGVSIMATVQDCGVRVGRDKLGLNYYRLITGRLKLDTPTPQAALGRSDDLISGE